MADGITYLLGRQADVEALLGHLSRGVLFLPLLDPPPVPLQPLTLWLHSAAGDAFETGCTVLQLLPVGMVVECADAAAVVAWLGSLHLAGEGPAAFTRWGRVEPDAAPEAQGDGAVEHGPLYERIRAMSTSEKIQLALTGDKASRTLLLKDPNKNIHTFVIQNKKITLDEVRFIAGYRQSNPDVLKTISEHREWQQNPQIVTALVGNPKTPATIATKLLSRLPTAELRRIAKSGSMPRAVTIAARKIVNG